MTQMNHMTCTMFMKSIARMKMNFTNENHNSCEGDNMDDENFHVNRI